jgi:hypothetical protein
MEREMSNIQKALELEGMLLRAAEAENAVLRKLLQEARDVCYRAAEDELVARIDAASK